MPRRRCTRNCASPAWPRRHGSSRCETPGCSAASRAAASTPTTESLPEQVVRALAERSLVEHPDETALVDDGEGAETAVEEELRGVRSAVIPVERRRRCEMTRHRLVAHAAGS